MHDWGPQSERERERERECLGVWVGVVHTPPVLVKLIGEWMGREKWAVKNGRTCIFIPVQLIPDLRLGFWDSAAHL